MDNYNNLVSQILSNEVLAKYVEDLYDETHLNLITTDWKSRLENDATFQDFTTKSKSLWKPPIENENYRYETSKGPKLSVIMVGYCKFVKPYGRKFSKPGLTIFDSEPLTKIARAFTSDLHTSNQISSDFKFHFDECNLLYCDECREKAHLFGKAGYKITRLNQPCILDTKVFDGKRIVNRFLCLMETMFNQKFLAIMFLEIDQRYSYLNANKEKRYRISGTVSRIVGFNESKLTMGEKADIGPLVTFDYAPETLKEDKKVDKKENDCFDELQDYMTIIEKQSEKRKIITADDLEVQPKKKRNVIEFEDGSETEEELFLI